MKRLLSLISTVSLVSSTASAVIACRSTPLTIKDETVESTKKEILLSETSASIEERLTKSLSIKNYSELGKITVESSSKTNATVNYSEGSINILGLKKGSSVITIDATQAISAKTLKVDVLEKSLTVEEIESVERQDTISKLMSQYAKSLYLNQNALSDGVTHYSSSYQMKSIVKSKKIEDLGFKLSDFNSVEDLKRTSRYSDVSNKYFNIESMVASDVVLSDNLYQDYVVNPSIADSGAVDIVKNTLPVILSFLSNPSALKDLIPLLATDPTIISGFLTPELITTLSTVLSQENLENLKNALSNDIYAGMNYQTALNSSVIGLSNALDKMVNGSDYTKLSYSLQSDVDSNISKANKTLAKNAYALINGDVSISIDILENIDSVAEIVRFARTLLVYLEQFSIEDMKSGVLTMEKIESKRSTAVSSNVVDFKVAIEKISYMINEDTTGVVFKNYIGALLLTNYTGFSLAGQYSRNDNDGIMGFVAELAVEALGNTLVEVLGIKVHTNALVRAFVNGGLKSEYGGKYSFWTNPLPMFSTVMNNIFSVKDRVPSPVKEILTSIDNAGDASKFQSDWMGYLWNNTNEELNFNLKDLFTTPINEISLSGLTGTTTKDEIAEEGNGEETEAPVEEKPVKRFDEAKTATIDFFDGKSIKDIVDEMSTAFSKTQNAKIDFEDFASIIEALSTNNALENGLKNPDTLLTELGLNSDGSIKSGSALDKVFIALENSKEITASISSLLTVWNNQSANKAKTLEIEAQKIFNSLKVTTEINGINDFNYVVTYNDGNGNVNTNTFNIKLKYKDKKLIISEINLI